jgi:hypothetical protein
VQSELSELLKQMLEHRESLRQVLSRNGGRDKAAAMIEFSIAQLNGLITLAGETSATSRGS